MCAVLACGEEGHRPVHDQEALRDLVEGADLDVNRQSLEVGDDPEVMSRGVLVERAYAAAPGQHPLFSVEAHITQKRGGAFAPGLDGEQLVAGLVHGQAYGLVDPVESGQQTDTRNLCDRLGKPVEGQQWFERLRQPGLVVPPPGDVPGALVQQSRQGQGRRQWAQPPWVFGVRVQEPEAEQTGHVIGVPCRDPALAQRLPVQVQPGLAQLRRSVLVPLGDPV